MPGTTTVAQAVSLCDQLRKEFNGSNIAQTQKTLDQLKMILASLNLLIPASMEQNGLLLTREVLEIGALLSIRSQDISGFERYMTQLKTFFREYKDYMPESPRMFMLLGLNLLRLLAQGRISEFHSELEAIGSLHLKNVYISHPIAIEQALMEGSYNKVWRARSNVPAKEYTFFMDILTGTIRHEIAKCSEKAYHSLPLADAATLLYFKTQDEVLLFAKERNWTIDQKSKVIHFVGQVSHGPTDIPVDDVIHNVLSYAKELERIV